MSSGRTPDPRARSLGEERRARLAGRPGRTVDRIEEVLVDRDVDAYGLSRKLNRDDGYRRTLRILDESRIGLQLFKSTHDRERIAVLDHPRDMECESLSTTRQRLVKASPAGDAAGEIREGNAVSAILFVDEGVHQTAQDLTPVSLRIGQLPIPSRLAKNRPERTDRNFTNTHVNGDLARPAGVDGLDVIAGTAAPNDPTIISQPADNLLRCHHSTIHSEATRSRRCVYLHTIVMPGKNEIGLPPLVLMQLKGGFWPSLEFDG